MPTSALLELAKVLDRAGFAYLEVSGGGTFDAAVRRGVESPWERIRALKRRRRRRLRSRSADASSSARGRSRRHRAALRRDGRRERDRRVPPARPAERRREPARGGRGDPRRPAASSTAASSTAPTAATRSSTPRSACRRSVRRACCSTIPPGCSSPARAGELVAELHELSGLPVGLYCQGAGRNALAVALEAARRGADLIACAIYPVALAAHRISGEAAAEALVGLGLDTGVDEEVLWKAADLVDEHLGDTPAPPLLPRIAVRAARRKLPVAVVAAVDVELRARNAVGRLDEVLDEVDRVRVEAGSPPLAAPMGNIIATQALVNVLGANRYGDDRRRARRPRRRPLRHDARPRSTRRSSGRSACAASRRPRSTSTSTRCARARRAWPRARRSCCCSRSSAPTPSGC